MKTERFAKITALVGTALCAALVLFVLSVAYLSVKAHDDPARPKSEIFLDEEFVEVIEQPHFSVNDGNEEASSHLDEPVTNQTQPTPAAGTDLADNAPAAQPPKVVAAKEESPVKVKNDKTDKPGSVVDKKKEEQEKVKREANNEVANAFANAKGKNNALTSNTADNGPSGQKTDNPGQQGTTGHGTGTVGGGWIIPKYAPVASTVTGSVSMSVKIDATGHVVSIAFTGGTPPAATNQALKNAIEREVKSRKFSRSNYDNAEPATAYITYTFK